MPVNLTAPQAADLYPVPGVRIGVAEAGIRKPGRKDLTVVLIDEGASVAGVFTQNRFCAAPVQVCREHLAGGGITITGVSKGAGMIRPNMATMLGFIATDATISQPLMQQLAWELAESSFNRVTVDGDTSTNDSFVVIATNKAGLSINSLDSP